MANTRYLIKKRTDEGEIVEDEVSARYCRVNNNGNLIFSDEHENVILAYHPDEWLEVIDQW